MINLSFFFYTGAKRVFGALFKDEKGTFFYCDLREWLILQRFTAILLIV